MKERCVTISFRSEPARRARIEQRESKERGRREDTEEPLAAAKRA